MIKVDKRKKSKLDTQIARKSLHEQLQELDYDFGDGRVIQTRPKDQQNIEWKIKVIEAGGTGRFIMKDNKVHNVTISELQQALQSGITEGGLLYEQYMDTLI